MNSKQNKRRIRKGRKGGKKIPISSQLVTSVPTPLRLTNILKDQIPQFGFNGASVASATFIMNSVYKPDGVNSTANLTFLSYGYSRVLVRRSRIRVTVINLSSAIGGRFCVYASSVSGISASYQLSSEQRGAQTGEVSLGVGGPAKSVVDMQCDISSFLGLQRLGTSDVVYTGTPTSVPTIPFYWQIYAISDDGTTNLNLTVNVELWFDCMWYGPVLAVA